MHSPKDLLRSGDPNAGDDEDSNLRDTGNCGVVLLGEEMRSSKWAVPIEDERAECRLSRRCSGVLEVGEAANHGARPIIRVRCSSEEAAFSELCVAGVCC